MTERLTPQFESTGKQWRVILLNLSLLVGLWWSISAGSITAWIIGIPAVALAGWASQRLGGMSESRISITGLLNFIPYFFWESLRGGLDVALRTLMPRMRIQPGFIHYHTSLQGRSAQTFFANCVSLLPGTLAADLQDDSLEIHVLNMTADPYTELASLERAIARLFVDQGDT